MDIAVLSDIHGNHIALEKCIEFLLERKIENFIFLGDYLGEFPYPDKTMDLLYDLKEKYNCYFIKGTKEETWLTYAKSVEKNWQEKNSTTGALLYNYRHLRKEDWKFFEELEMCKKIQIQGIPSITVCHGSPEDINEGMNLQNKRLYDLIEDDESKIILCGHTHIKQKVEHEGKILINPGSVGLSRFGFGKAQVLILHADKQRVKGEFVSIPYDRNKAIEEIRDSGLIVQAPAWCKITNAILKGKLVTHTMALVKAMELCKNDFGSCVWPNVPEKYWRQALAELID